MRRSLTVLTAALMIATMVVAMPVQAASAFADPQFQDTWNQGESGAANFWGPLSTAHDGQKEVYKEGTNGVRLVQYFDKARMELRRPPFTGVSTGLLTTELKTGAMQTGDAAFEQRQPAKIGLVGDPGSAGPTYADLALLPEKDGRPGKAPAPYFYDAGKFGQAQNLPNRASRIPETRFSYKLDDPSGRFSQYVFYPFWDFIQSLPLPLSQTTGYAISPIIWVHATIGGKPTEVLVQAFERRVLTWNDSGPVGKEVEFGNIGQHYYQWRYQVSSTPPSPPTTPAPSPAPASAVASTAAPVAPAATTVPVPAVVNGTVYTDQNGKWTITYPAGWSANFNGIVTSDFFGPHSCLFTIGEGPKLSSFTLNDELDILRGVAVPGKGAGLGPAQTVSIGGESGKMFAYRSAATSTSANADYGLYAIAFHGDKLYTLSYGLSYVTQDTCGTDARAMIASFRFGTSGNAVASASAGTAAPTTYSADLDCANFASQADAQAYLRLYPDDPSNLDANHNGIACQDNKSPYDKTPVAVTNIPASSSTGGSSGGGCTSNCSVYVSGYYTKTGRYVAPYYRSPPGTRSHK